MGFLHSFETRSDGRPGLMIGSRVRWVDPGWPGSTKKKNNTMCINYHELDTKCKANVIDNPSVHFRLEYTVRIFT
jgi:hypothetical protein